jgi:putative phage-type endonuclease
MNDIVYLNDLSELRNIIDEFEIDELINESEKEELKESMNEIMDIFIHENLLFMSNPNFDEYLKEYTIDNIKKFLIYSELFCEEIMEESINFIIDDIYESAYLLYFKNIIPKRCCGPSFIRNKNINVENMDKKIEIIKNKPQPTQKTTEWYEFRHNILTASNIWKALKSESTKNQLIYEKCSPLNVEKYNTVNMDSTLHHGNKYEDVSIMFYEKMYNTKVEDFGCIQHDVYKFIGASPDGINVDKTSPLFGRMLEIKNIVNREINGNPKEEYWIQMQVQMETCNLNECDFLETRFYEYESEEDFEQDGTFTISNNDKLKGIMICFMIDGYPKYEYSPLGLSREDHESWKETIMEKHNNHTWLKNIYWRLEEYSCVLVLRNKDWFKKAVIQMKELWDIVEKERITGYEHRRPKKIIKKAQIKEIVTIPSKCLIEIDTSDINLDQDNNYQDIQEDENHKN